MQFTSRTAVTADGTLWAWGDQRPAMLRDGRVDPEDPYDQESYSDIVRITDGVASAVVCSDRTLAGAGRRLLVAASQRCVSPGMGDVAGPEPRCAGSSLDQVRMPSLAPAWTADAPAPAVVESASLEAWRHGRRPQPRNQVRRPRCPPRRRRHRRTPGNRDSWSWASLRPPSRGWCWRPGCGAESVELSKEKRLRKLRRRFFSFTRPGAGSPDSSGAPPDPAPPL